jgi:hypothetical protein
LNRNLVSDPVIIPTLNSLISLICELPLLFEDSTSPSHEVQPVSGEIRPALPLAIGPLDDDGADRR